MTRVSQARFHAFIRQYRIMNIIKVLEPDETVYVLSGGITIGINFPLMI